MITVFFTHEELPPGELKTASKAGAEKHVIGFLSAYPGAEASALDLTTNMVYWPEKGWTSPTTPSA